MYKNKQFKIYFGELLNHYNWRLISDDHHLIVYKKTIEIDDYFLDIIFNKGLIILKVRLDCDFPLEKKGKIFYFVNYLNQISSNGKYVFNEECNVLIYQKLLKLNILQLLEENDLIDFFEDMFDEIDYLSKKVSMGVHQIKFSDKNIHIIKESIFTKTLGTA